MCTTMLSHERKTFVVHQQESIGEVAPGLHRTVYFTNYRRCLSVYVDLTLFSHGHVLNLFRTSRQNRMGEFLLQYRC